MHAAGLMTQVMTIHAALYAMHVQKLAGGLPYVLAGDFNLKPDSDLYQLLVTGTVFPYNYPVRALY